MSGLSLVMVSRGYSFGTCGLLIAVTSLTVHGLLGAWASVIVICGLSCLQLVESSQTRDRTRVDSLPLDHQGSPLWVSSLRALNGISGCQGQVS